MRLLNIHTLQFQEFFEREIPHYHILSHRWGRDEISYEEFTREIIPNKDGYRKVVNFCKFIRQRRQDGLISRMRYQRGGAFAAAATAGSDEDMSDLAAGDQWRALELGKVSESKEPKRLAGGDWVWVDTCCIDKRSSAELTEAINSMFAWYGEAYECIVHLNDVPPWEALQTTSPYRIGDYNDGHSHPRRKDDLEDKYGVELHPLGRARAYLRRSVWFKRGWTLQEMLAPEMVVFCNENWEVLGHICRTKRCSRNMYAYGLHLNETIYEITSIPRRFLNGDEPLYAASIAQRMSWASGRTTTRTEDEAYCLLGLFNVNMPMVYGEGRKAFRRLQLEIIQRSTDQSIFAWTQGTGFVPIFATSPAAFASSDHVTRPPRSGQNPYAITNNGLRLETQLFLPEGVDSEASDSTRIVHLLCGSGYNDRHKTPKPFTIELVQGQDRYFRHIPEQDSQAKGGKSLGQHVIYVDTGVEDTVAPTSRYWNILDD